VLKVLRMTEERIRSKFVGSLLGTFVGDALGMPVEGWLAEDIVREFTTLDRMQNAKPWVRLYSAIYGLLADPIHPFTKVRLGRGTYTDDTQMMIGVAESLVACGGFDGADMAERFVENYDPRRGYGPGARDAIWGLRHGMKWDEVGTKLFDGRGSFGNGGAMRVAPVGMLYHDKRDELRRIAELSASITHTHPVGKEGAVLQAFAVACSVQQEPGANFDKRAFLDEVQRFVRRGDDTFPKLLAAIGLLLAENPGASRVVDVLGNDVTVQGSFPVALHAALRHADSFPDAVVYAVSLGGDTDTIGAMTGAIAGALHGVEAIPSQWLEALENHGKGRDYVRKLAEDLYRTWHAHR